MKRLLCNNNGVYSPCFGGGGGDVSLSHLRLAASYNEESDENNNDDGDNNDEYYFETVNGEVVSEDEDFEDLFGPNNVKINDTEEDWIPDSEWARRSKMTNMKRAGFATAKGCEEKDSEEEDDDLGKDMKSRPKKSPYTDEEEELIEIMGGKFFEESSDGKARTSMSREPGFLGDCTLREISSDFQIPICYLADVMCSWGVPVPIDVNARLGDMVTGEQAFSLAEAIHSLDVGILFDRYSDDDLMGLCYEYDIELKDAFDFAVKEGWNLPFGVRTFLRVEQQEELVRALSEEYY